MYMQRRFLRPSDRCERNAIMGDKAAFQGISTWKIELAETVNSEFNLWTRKWAYLLHERRTRKRGRPKSKNHERSLSPTAQSAFTLPSATLRLHDPYDTHSKLVNIIFMPCLDYFYARIKRPRNTQLFLGDAIEEGIRERNRGGRARKICVGLMASKIFVARWGWKDHTTPLMLSYPLSHRFSTNVCVCACVYAFIQIQTRARAHTHTQIVDTRVSLVRHRLWRQQRHPTFL